MKRAIIVFVVAGLVLLTTALWFMSSQGSFKLTDIVHFGIIVMVAAFALYFGYRRLTDVKRGDPFEDEMSKKLMHKTASFSYFISLYLWVGLIFVADKTTLDTEELLGTGILGMAVIFTVCWLIFNYRGMKNE